MKKFLLLSQVLMSSLFFILFLFLNMGSLQILKAQITNNGVSIEYEKVNPDTFVRYGFKRLTEKGRGFITLYIFKNKRPDYLIDILERRVNELAYTVIKDKRSSLEESSSRYSTYTGIINNELNNFDEENKNNLSQKLKRHLTIINYLKTKFSHETAEWRFMQQDYESAEVLLSKLN